ncbi:MAG: GNAT family N-acetyltransferase [Clostridia bacterium]|nr:GNAT family N-acetyltransferase [Clostridia bacterium]
MITDITFDDVKAISVMHENNFRDHWKEEMLASTLSNGNFVGGKITDEKGEILSTVGFTYCLDEGELLFAVTEKNARGKGYAFLLLNKYFEKLSLLGVKNVFLEVRESNTPAINLYLKAGFKKISERKKYYGEETAFIYKKEL